MRAALVVLALLGLAALCATQDIPEAFVTINQGRLQGAVRADSRAFYSIPYAAPPTGENRFQPPKPASGWSNTRDARYFGPGCPQDCDLPPMTCNSNGTSEDCLMLDVFTPRLATISSPRPVLVFIHGGNYIQGGAETLLYDGGWIANHTNVVVVIINYRLGALAYFINDHLVGNLAIRDQQMSLRWVKDNIAKFGGDPNNVSISGQSAGGSSVSIHMVAPGSKDLFNSVTMDSNPIQLILKNKAQTKRLSDRFASLCGCNRNDLNCLRNANISTILHAQLKSIQINLLAPIQIFMPWQPMVDGDLIPVQPFDAFRNGNYKHVPFMLGNTQDEGTVFIYTAFPKPTSVELYRQILLLVFKTKAAQVEAMYPPVNTSDTREVIAQMGTDFIWACPMRNISRLMSRNHPVFYWHFDHLFSFKPWGPNYTICESWVCHGADLPFWFNTAPLGGYNWTSSETVLANEMATSIGNFATSGNPNSPYPVSPTWPNYNEQTGEDIHFTTPVSSKEQNYLKKYCDFWDTLGYHWGN